MTRKMMAGMMVRYAMAAAALSERPEEPAMGGGPETGGGIAPGGVV
jgi:hypothetical protein